MGHLSLVTPDPAQNLWFRWKEGNIGVFMSPFKLVLP